MRKWVTAFTLIASILGGAVGAGAHEGTGSMENMPDCCKKAQSAGNNPEVSLAQLCCKLNCSEPGSAAANPSPSFSIQQGATPNTAIIPGATAFNGIARFSRHTHAPYRDAHPKYIQHLALLI